MIQSVMRVVARTVLHSMLAGLLWQAVSAAAQTATNVPTDGLIVWLAFNDAFTNGVATDSGPLAHHGRAVGVAWTPNGRSGGAAWWTNDGAYIVIPAAEHLQTTQLTMAVWIKAVETSHGRTILEGGGPGGFKLGLMGDGPHRGRPFASVGGIQVVGDSAVNDDFWHHVTLVMDGSALKLYVDAAQQKQTAALTNAWPGAKGEWSLGMNRAHPTEAEKDRSFLGRMDELRVYNRPLDSAAISAIYMATKPQFSKAEVARRIAELKELKARGLLLDDFFERKMRECEQ